ncbi:fatty acid desaturase-domain-containing protein [Gaertneriomyces semiglobifer]|nr:fatty acid desaturase-domain-containing protein [Gaertneriomyces semiglobifer]
MCQTDVVARKRIAAENAARRTAKREACILTRADIDERGEKGDVLVIIDHKVYDLTKFLKVHPGGDLAILHMKGKDATDAVLAYHPEETIKTRMPHYCIGRLAPEDVIINEASEDFRKLNAQLKEQGLYDTNYWFYARETLKLFLLWGAMVALVVKGQCNIAYVASALCAATLWHQSAFIAHDAGHSGITHDSATDMRTGICLGNFLGGLSLGWWKHSHNVHHIQTNSTHHDPDIQLMPFFAITTKFFEDIHSTYYNRTLVFDAPARFLVSIQHYLYYIVLCFGRFNLHALSWTHVLSPRCIRHRTLEIVCMTLHWCWFLPLLSYIPEWKWRIAYILISYCSTMFLHLQITLSHYGMPVDVHEEETFAGMALRTTMDVECPAWMDWFHGGLQFQVEHHLFPRLPRHNLRKTRALVRSFAKKHDLPFHTYGFIEGNTVVLNTLRTVAHQVKAVCRVDPKLACEHMGG